MTEHPTPKEQLDDVWEELRQHNSDPRNVALEGRKWPGYDELLHDITNADYNDILACPMDMRTASTAQEKSICPFGLVCKAKIELFPLPPGMEAYTGLLAPGTTLDHCLIRLSSAMKPPSFEVTSTWARSLLRIAGRKLQNAKLFPTAAIKVFRGNGIHSGNLLLLGSKVGQPEDDYFAHCLSTQATEKMPKVLKPFVRKFWTYSDFPLSLGTSDFCSMSVDGAAIDSSSINFPYIVVLKPVHQRPAGRVQNNGKDFDSFDRFLDDVQSIPEGSHLFDIFATPDPRSVADPSKLQRIGRVVSTSSMVKSTPNDRLFFKHQRREEDFVIRPRWREEAKSTRVVMDKGRTVGSVAAIAGWRLFEEQIATNKYVDYDKAIRDAPDSATDEQERGV